MARTPNHPRGNRKPRNNKSPSSPKQRRVELDARRAAKRAENEERERLKKQRRLEADRRKWEQAGIAVNQDSLAPNNSFSVPDFVQRGYYIDQPFTCIDCGIEQLWTAQQQKWWYEIAKGDLFTTAVRCRACRRRERERKTTARKVYMEGLAKKRSKV